MRKFEHSEKQESELGVGRKWNGIEIVSEKPVPFEIECDFMGKKFTLTTLSRPTLLPNVLAAASLMASAISGNVLLVCTSGIILILLQYITHKG